MNMNTRYFTIDFGNDSGPYCVYCGKKIIPKGNEGLGVAFQCDCPDATQEIALLKAQADAKAAYADWQKGLNARSMRIIEWTKRAEAHQKMGREFLQKIQNEKIPDSKDSSLR